jgi:serine/threonine protein kinase
MTKIKREIKIMQAVEDVPGVSRFIEVCVEPGTQKVLLATAFVEGIGLSSVTTSLDEKQIKSVVYQILHILAKTNERGIMHRDVKPANMILNTKSNELTLLDWGLAEFYVPEKEYFVKVSTRPYKAPELLTGIKKYDYRMDVWSAGCILAAMVGCGSHSWPRKNTYSLPLMMTPHLLSKSSCLAGTTSIGSSLNSISKYLTNSNLNCHLLVEENLGAVFCLCQALKTLSSWLICWNAYSSSIM